MKNVVVDIFNTPNDTVIIDAILNVFKEVGVSILKETFDNTNFSFLVEPGEDINRIEKELQDGFDRLSEYFAIELEYVIEIGDVDRSEFLSIPENCDTSPNRIDDLLIVPYGYEADLTPYDVKDVLMIDNSKAFGSGHHSSTISIIYGMKKYLTADCSVLDIGAGDGILSLYASVMGAKSVTCVDSDLASKEAIYDNALINSIDITNYSFFTDLNECNNTYDIITMNLPPYTTKTMLNKVVSCMNESSKLILSGFFVTDGKTMCEEVSKYFKIIDTIHIDNWEALICTVI